MHQLVNKDFDMLYHICWCFYVRLNCASNYSVRFEVYVVTCLTARNMEDFKFSTRFTIKFSVYFSLQLKVDYLEAVSIAFFEDPCNS